VAPSPRWMADELGPDLAAHKAIRIDRQLLNGYHLILVMEEHQREALAAESPQITNKVFPLAKVAQGVVYDFRESDELRGRTFVDVAHEVCSLVDTGFQEICLLARRLEYLALSHGIRRIADTLCNPASIIRPSA